MAQNYRYDALSRQSFEVLAYNAVGRASEVNLGAAYALQHSTGNSGWSVGIMQWDFGQPGRGEAAAEMLRRYSEWAPTDQRFTQT
ncbi:hypothetical protein XBLMG947_0091 [Xanthomonas bromi]|uniref:Uncharacterized protein n=1 Tax=Xanthomonas bromi TaxID=56449 RepID=A0A1C3NFY1_9XANT|nr:hypothetical protein XBLMG947_0091 [Xanthomonas bromi]